MRLPPPPPPAVAARPRELPAEPARLSYLLPAAGSNLQALIDATTAGWTSVERIPNARITHVISNRSAAFGLERCARASPPIPTDVLALKTYQTRNPGATREHYDEALAALVRSHAPDLVVLAGFMHILSPTFLGALPAGLPIINLHPALPGAFDGAAAIPRALAAFEAGEVDRTGVMVHRVVAEVDRGEPVCVREVEIKQGDSLADLEQRIHAVEHILIVQGARKVLEERDAAPVEEEKASADEPASKEEAAAIEEKKTTEEVSSSAAPSEETSDAPASEEAAAAAEDSPVEKALEGLKI